MSTGKNGTKDVEARLAIVITAFVLALLLFIVYGVIEKGLDPYGAATIIGALLGMNAFIIAILKLRQKRDEEKEELKQSLQTCKNDLRDSHAKVEEHNKTISENENEIRTIKKELENLKQEYDTLNQLKDELESNLTTTSDELESAKNAYEKTKNDLLETGTKLSDALIQIEECNVKINELSSSVESLTKENQKNEQLVQSLTVENTKLKNDVNRAKNEIIQYSNTIEAFYSRVATTLVTGARKIEERHLFRTGLNKDEYIFMVKNNGTSPCYRLNGNFIIHRRVGNPISIPIEYPAIYEGAIIEFGPTEIQMGIECLGIDVVLEYQDLLGRPHRYNHSISPERIHVEKT